MDVFAKDLTRTPVIDAPFPHAVIDGLFAPDLFESLAASYPVCPPASGPTGRTIHRGDDEFDAVMAANEPWRELFAACNSPRFVRMIAGVFAAELVRSCAVAAEDVRFIDHIESRVEKESRRIARPAHDMPDNFVRFDFMQGMTSYSRGAHLDHRRRLGTMLIYFDAPGPQTFSGGDLILHDTDGKPAARIAPAANRAVLFPCSERSWHSVEAVTACTTPRRFLQLSVSSCHDIWSGGVQVETSALQKVKQLLRPLARFAVR